ncbi:MAG TPA: gamma-glutamyl-phosphate reductase, partial [Arthrobacter sp.]|nr:gamma-glutamyl-phosphate reductase [Arthrobacter sp.]
MTQTAASQTPAVTEQSAAEQPDVTAAVHSIAERSRIASRRMARANRAWKDRALVEIAEQLVAKRDIVLHANRLDVEKGRDNGTSKAMLDRLKLDPVRIDSLAAALRSLAGLPDPVGTVMRGQTLPNGLRLR